MKPGKSTFYHPELDALRFVAFFLVFLAHSVYHVSIDWAHLSRPAWIALFSLTHAGFYGVDLFFALSAYLITELLLRERDSTGSIHLRQFYLRRILRIWPLYFAFLLVIRPLAGLIIPNEHLSAGALAWFLLLAGNWRCVLFGWPPSIADQLWSISVEEQFYLIWPPILRRIGTPNLRRRLVQASIAMLVIANLSRLAIELNYPSDTGTWCDTFARLDPIAGGILLATWLHGRDNPLTRCQRWTMASIAAATLLLVGFFGDHTDWRSMYSYPLAGIACTLLLAAILSTQGNWRPGAVGNVLIYLGRISYGLYIFHILAFCLVQNILPSNVPLTMLMALSLTIAVAAISYRLLERPFLRLKERFTLVHSRDSIVVTPSVPAAR